MSELVTPKLSLDMFLMFNQHLTNKYLFEQWNFLKCNFMKIPEILLMYKFKKNGEF